MGQRPLSLLGVKTMEARDDQRADKSGLCKEMLKTNLLLLLTLLGVVVGFGVGFWLRTVQPSAALLMWTGLPGDLFLRLLNMLIIPLIVGSVISASSTLDPKLNGKVSLVAFAWVVVTNVLACVLALSLSIVIKPGHQGYYTRTNTRSDAVEIQDIFADLFRNLVPDNIVEVAFRKTVTKYKSSNEGETRIPGNLTVSVQGKETRWKSVEKTNAVNILGLIMICVLVSNAAGRLGKKAKVFVSFFNALTDIVIKIFKWFFWTVPLGVASMIAKSIASIVDLADSFSKVGMFAVVVVLGAAIFQFAVLPFLLFLLTRRNPYRFQMTILHPYLVVFASSTTAAAIPEMLYCCELKNNLKKEVTRFVIPFCVTLSSNGIAIFVVSAAIFSAQYLGLLLSHTDYFIILVVTAVSCLASPSVPSSGLVTLVMVLTAVNIPSDTIALLFTVEWLLDRVRSGINVVSNCYCAAVVNDLCLGVKLGGDGEQMKDCPISESNSKDANHKHGESNVTFVDEENTTSRSNRD